MPQVNDKTVKPSGWLSHCGKKPSKDPHRHETGKKACSDGRDNDGDGMVRSAANKWSTLIIYLYLDSDRMYVWGVGLTRQKDCDGEGVSHHEILRIVSLLEHSIISCLFVPCRADFDCRTGKDTKTQCQKTETGRECYDNRDNDKVRLASSLRCTFA